MRNAQSIGRMVALMLAVAMAAAEYAGAQGHRMGISTALPGPVSSLELARYGEMIALTAEQQHAWTAAHERYKSDFKALGADGGVLQRFIGARTAAEGVPFRAQPSRSVIDRWMSAHQAATSAIRTLDERLFDEIAPLLTEEQSLQLPRVRIKREHARLLSDELVREWMNPVTETSLTEVFLSVLVDAAKPESGIEALDQELSAAVWSVLDAHQSQCNGWLRDVQESGRGMYGDWARLLEERGIPVNAVDIAKRDTVDREMLTKVSQSWREATEKVKPRVTELQRAIRSRTTSVAGMLPPKFSEGFQRRFFTAAYHGAAAESLAPYERRLQQALDYPDLTEDERVVIQSYLDDCHRTILALSKQFADGTDLIHEGERPNSSFHSPEARAAMEEASAAIAAESRRFDGVLLQVLGEQRMRAMSQANRDARLTLMIMDAGITDPDEIADALARFRSTGSAFLGRRESFDRALPDVLPRVSIEAACRAMNVLDERMTLVQQLHRDYASQYRRTFDVASSEIHRLAPGGWISSPDGRLVYASADAIESAREREREAHAMLQSLDVAFLSDVEAILDLAGDALWQVRLGREWNAFARGARRGPNDLRTYEAYVPLMKIVDDLSLSPEDAAKADAIFRARAEEAIAAARTHFEANRAAWYARERSFAVNESALETVGQAGVEAQHAAIEREKTAGEKREALAMVVRSILDELIAALPAHADALADGYERAAYPKVFDGRTLHRDAVTRALALPDLTSAQQTALQDAVARYRPAQREVIVRLIAANREWDRERPFSSFYVPEREAAKLKWDQIKFERDELDASMLATLKRVLTAEQLHVIGVDSRE